MTASSPPWLIRLTHVLLDYRHWWLTLSVILTIAAWFPASRLEFEQSIESLYSKDNLRLAAWRESKKTFGGDEFVVVAYTDPDLFEAGEDKLTDGAKARIEALVDKLKQVKGLQEDSFQNLANALQAPIGRSIIRKLMEGVLVGMDGQTTAIFCRLEPEGTSQIPRARTYQQVREIASAHNPPAAVVGEPVQGDPGLGVGATVDGCHLYLVPQYSVDAAAAGRGSGDVDLDQSPVGPEWHATEHGQFHAELLGDHHRNRHGDARDSAVS